VYLFDTNVLSEIRKLRPNEQVWNTIAAIPPETLFLSAITLGEIEKGRQKLPEGPRRKALTEWLEYDIPQYFAGRILAIDGDIMITWGRLVVHHPRTLPVMDSLLAATCLHHHLTLLTRNEKDFDDIEGITVCNPWNDRQIPKEF
jgi:predicted nucleic acid-binding protein